MARNQDLPLIPKMYLAQIEERCSLQYAAIGDDRKQWLKEWSDPKQDGKSYVHDKPSITKEGKPYEGSKLKLKQNTSIYCLEIKFEGRVVSNGGRDSIIRPVMGKNGIPFIPGSSIKGLFRRACDSEQKVKYCGNTDRPGILRFHGIYPIGDWVKGMEDIVHPQQKRQVETQASSSAYTLISFHKPTMIFEISSSAKNTDWKEVETILTNAVRNGIGGKTSTGYGFSSDFAPEFTIENNPQYDKSFHFQLEGIGVSSKLLNGTLEFRPNMFKASLRGHTSRLLAGVCSNETLISQTTNNLFGSTNSPGNSHIYWQQIGKPSLQNTYRAQGILHILAPEFELEFIKFVLSFAYIMAGFGKTWRRVSHAEFYPDYLKQTNKFDIGCHWKNSTDTICINSPEKLKVFLNELYTFCQQYLSMNSLQFVSKWRESWHPENVVVYSGLISKTQILSDNPEDRRSAIKLFHEEPFKLTPAIGGKEIKGEPKFVSSVWHRMLPISSNQYLEIITIFHYNPANWRNSLQPFIKSIKERGLHHTWGNEPKN
jgi:CRISPR-associated protein Cmr6